MKKLIISLLLLFSVSLFANTIKAPEISGYNQYNKIETLNSYKGKYVILIFWSIKCHFCKEELPSINNLYKEFGENKEKIVDFLNSNNYIFPTIFDKKALKSFSIKAYPTMYILDKNGDILNYAVGAIPEATLRKYIKTTLLKKSL